MPRRRNSALAAAVLAGAALAGCGNAAADKEAAVTAATSPACANGAASTATSQPPPPVLVMTSLPLFWPLGAAMGDMLSGAAEPPWQQAAFGPCYAPLAIDTLSPDNGAAPDDPANGPLGGHARLAVIQPRGLSPADNVALDSWVRGGGRLLLMLDPALTGEYDLPLGDPRRPIESALIPPVVARWGMAVGFDEAQEAAVATMRLGDAPLPLALAGVVTITDPAAAQCTLLAQGAAARCAVGKGRVTLIADAALFEHPELAGEGGASLRAVLEGAFE
jgi:hypothetical protein